MYGSHGTWTDDDLGTERHAILFLTTFECIFSHFSSPSSHLACPNCKHRRASLSVAAPAQRHQSTSTCIIPATRELCCRHGPFASRMARVRVLRARHTRYDIVHCIHLGQCLATVPAMSESAAFGALMESPMTRLRWRWSCPNMEPRVGSPRYARHPTSTRN